MRASPRADIFKYAVPGVTLISVLSLLSACGGSSASKPSAADLLQPRLGQAGILADPSSLDCDSVSKFAVGDTVSCSYTTNGQPVALSAKVASVNGTKIAFTLTTKAEKVPAAVLASSVASRVAAQLGASISSVTCAGDLMPQIGAATTCVLKNGSETKTVPVKVASVSDGEITYSIGAS